MHPVFVHLPDAPRTTPPDARSRPRRRATALHPVEVIDIPAPPAPRAPDLIKAGATQTAKLAFDDALRNLDAAAAEVAASGGARAVDERACRRST